MIQNCFIERTRLRCRVVNKFICQNALTVPLPPFFLDQTTLVEQVKRVKEIEAIESDSFVQQTFRSSKEVKKVSFRPSIMNKPLDFN